MVDRKESAISFSSSSKQEESKNYQNQILESKDKEVSNEFKKIEFTGNAKDYFGIWIVNLILSIVTLGVYSAWAKVRREVYFKNNTKIFDAGFGYHATGGQIFKGRLVAFVILAAVNIVYAFLPFFGLAILPVFLFLLPWILNHSMRFSARMTSYRNIRFNWRGTYWKTFWFLVIAPVIGILSLGLLTPLISKSYYAYFAGSHSYGTTNFTSKPKVGQFYCAFLVGGILPTILLSCLVFTLMIIGQEFGESRNFEDFLVVWATITFYVFIFSITFIYAVLCRNFMVKSLILGAVLSFNSRISPARFVWISLSNLILTILSIGLLLPWAKVRMYRYLSDSTLIKMNGNIEKFVDDEKSAQSSLGEAIADFEGVEVSV